jgi:hypothetical protein
MLELTDEAMIRYFKNDDQAYAAWLRSNPTGYVFNDFTGTSSLCKTLHSAGCRLLRSPSSFYSRTYTLKVCSVDLNELIDWIEKNRGPEGQGYFPCESCRPFNIRDDHFIYVWDGKLTEEVWR